MSRATNTTDAGNLNLEDKIVKPYADFPLTIRTDGRLCKKFPAPIGYRYFGRIEAWEDALAKYQREKPYLERGETPPAENAVVGVTTDEACNRFLLRELKRKNAGEIGDESYLNTRDALADFLDYFGRNKSVLALRPSDFEDWRLWLKSGPPKGRPKGALGAYALDRHLGYVSACMGWVEGNLLDGQRVRSGDALRGVNRREKRKARTKAQAGGNQRIITPDAAKAILAACSPTMEAMFLLALNGGYGSTDLSLLQQSVVDFKGGWIDHYRNKTGIFRFVPLWKRTADALQKAIESRPKPKADTDADLCFLTRCGARWVRRRKINEAGKEDGKSNIDSIGYEFQKLLKRLNLKRPGLGFYSAKHAFWTYSGGSRDDEARRVVAGLAHPNETEWYLHRDPETVSRLRAVTDHVERVFFGQTS